MYTIDETSYGTSFSTNYHFLGILRALKNFQISVQSPNQHFYSKLWASITYADLVGGHRSPSCGR